MSFKRLLLNYLTPFTLFILIIFIGIISIRDIDNISRDLVERNLYSNLNSAITNFDVWFKKAGYRSTVILKSKKLSNFFEFNQSFPSKFLKNFVRGEHLFAIHLLDKNGRILSSSEEVFEGIKLKPKSTNFLEKLKNTKKPFFEIPYEIEVKGGDISTIALIANSYHNTAGEFKGAVVLVYDSKSVFDEIFAQVKTGDSGEVYAFSNDGVMISGSRFEDQLEKISLLKNNEHSMLNIKLYDPGKNLLEVSDKIFKKEKLTFAVASALSKGEGKNIQGYRDYRGVNVVGGWRWLQEFNIGVVSEVDYDEAFHSKKILQNRFILILIVFFIFIYLYLIISFREYKNISSLKISNDSFREKNADAYNFLKAIDEHALISKTDIYGVITYANERFQSVSQYTLDELVGKNHNIVNSNFHDRIFFENFWKTLKSKKTWCGVIRNKAKDQSLYWVDITIIPVLDKNDEVIEFISIGEGITNFKEIKK